MQSAICSHLNQRTVTYFQDCLESTGLSIHIQLCIIR